MSDLAHEYILTFCSALACAAVLAPLLLLFGLRYGTIEALHHRLLEDPRNREVRPKFGQTFPRDWFKEMTERSDVAFIMPNIRQIAAEVEARRAGSDDKATSVDIVPTASGDPLLVAYGAPNPGEEDCVLTAASAAALGVQQGDRVQVMVGRTDSTGFQQQSMMLRVAGVLPEQAGTLRLMYITLPLVEAIEQFRDGLAVPRLGWRGATGEVAPLYDGFVVFGQDLHLGAQQYAKLSTGTGITEILPIQAKDAIPILGYPALDEGSCILLTASGGFVDESSLKSVISRLKGSNGTSLTVHPFLRPKKAILRDRGTKHEIPVKLVSVPSDVMGRMGLPAFESKIRPTAYMAPEPALPSPLLLVSEGKRSVEIPLTVRSAPLDPGVLFISMELGGRLNQLRDRHIEFEAETGMIKPMRRSYTSFRLYTRSLEDVVEIERLFREGGMEVNTAADRIKSVLRLDRDLRILFWLISGVAIVGGLFTLATSLYASIERKRRDLGVLRLLGVPLQSLVIFPMWQGMVIVAVGLAISMVLYFIGSLVADSLFAGQLGGGKHLCMIKGFHIEIAAALTQMLAILAALLASARLSRSDPATDLRKNL
jgi:putative ABC transport system permease protein